MRSRLKNCSSATPVTTPGRTSGDITTENAAALRRLLQGEAGAYRDIVLLNSAAAFLVGDKVETLREGVDLAAAVIDDGRAQAALDKLVSIARR